MLIRTRDGATYWAPNTLEPVAFELWLNGSYEPEVLAYLRNAVPPHAAVIDVGANIGAITIPLARHLTHGRVLAIEASPRICKVLAANVGHNALDNVTICASAASNRTAGIDFYEPPSSHFGMGSQAPQFNVRAIEVPGLPLDAMLDAENIGHVAAMKVDVEGFEAHVFLGAPKLLHSNDPPKIVFEFCDWAEDRAFPGRAGWAQEILQGLGYAIWRLPDLMAGGPPLGQPIRQGSHTLIAAR
jgi:FkbM family methyltransferase